MIYMPDYSKGPKKSMTTSETSLNQNLSSTSENIPSNQSETAPENSSGPVNNVPMVSGSALMQKYLLTKGINTSIRSTSEPNTTMTQETWIVRPSQEITFSTIPGISSSHTTGRGSTTAIN